eukprot:403336459
MENVAQNFRLQTLINAWKELCGYQKILRVKNQIAVQHRDKTLRLRIVYRYFRALKKHMYIENLARKKDQQFNIMAQQFQMKIHWMGIKRNAFRRLRIAPKITKADHYKRFQLKRKVFLNLLLNRDRIQEARNQLLIRNQKVINFRVSKYFYKFKILQLRYKMNNDKALMFYIRRLIKKAMFGFQNNWEVNDQKGYQLTQKADFHYASQLLKKSLASLFINKCKIQMRQNTIFTAEEKRILYFHKLKLQAFDSLRNNWLVENYKSRKNSELAQLVLYQWSVYVKLNKIGNRYNKNDTHNQSNYSQSVMNESQHKNNIIYVQQEDSLYNNNLIENQSIQQKLLNRDLEMVNSVNNSIYQSRMQEDYSNYYEEYTQMKQQMIYEESLMMSQGTLNRSELSDDISSHNSSRSSQQTQKITKTKQNDRDMLKKTKQVKKSSMQAQSKENLMGSLNVPKPKNSGSLFRV